MLARLLDTCRHLTSPPEEGTGLSAPSGPATTLRALPAPEAAAVPPAARPAELDLDIEIPGLAPGQRAFNAGLARHRGHLVLAFRLESRGSPLGPNNQIACLNLGADLRARGPFTVLPIPRIPHTLHTAEDPRLLDHAGRLMVVFNMSDNGRVDGPRHIHLGAIDTREEGDGLAFSLAGHWRLIFTAPGRGVQPVEKNWAPFSYGGAIHFAYQTRPHLVIRLGVKSLEQPAGTTLYPAALPRLSSVTFPWPAGLPRGGSQAVYDPDLDRFVTFFHSSWVDRGLFGPRGQPSQTYLFGCMTFHPRPPFDVDRVSAAPLCTAALIRELLRPVDADADGKRVLFVQGLVVEPDAFLLSLGRGDRFVSICRLGREGVLAGLTEVPAPGP